MGLDIYFLIVQTEELSSSHYELNQLFVTVPISGSTSKLKAGR